VGQHPDYDARIPRIGWRVHYVSRGSLDGEYKPECRPGTIFRVYNVLDGPPYDLGILVINEEGMHWARNIPFDPEMSPGTWHWPVDYGGDCDA